MTVTMQDIQKLKSIKEAWEKAVAQNCTHADAKILLKSELTLVEKAKIAFAEKLFSLYEYEGMGAWKLGRPLVSQFEASLSAKIAVFGQKVVADALPAEAKTQETIALIDGLGGKKTAQFLRDPYNYSLFKK